MALDPLAVITEECDEKASGLLGPVAKANELPFKEYAHLTRLLDQYPHRHP